MKRTLLTGFSIAAILASLVGTASANTVTLTFTGVNGATQGGFYVSPYYATVGGTPDVSIYCDDFLHEITFNETWTANISTFDSLTNVRFNTGTHEDVVRRYDEEAWLIEQLASNPTHLGDINFAMWAIMDPAVETDAGFTTGTLGSQYWLTLAESKTFTPGEFSNWEVLTPTSSDPGSAQEMFTMVPTPEPASLTLLGTGLLALGAFIRKKKK